MNPGERKAALFLASLPLREQKRLLALLPQESSRTLHRLIGELRALDVPLDGLVQELLASEVSGLTEETSPTLEQILTLSKQLPGPWFARMLVSWGGVNRQFVLELLDASIAVEVRNELGRIGKLPPKLVDALRAEATTQSGRAG